MLQYYVVADKINVLYLHYHVAIAVRFRDIVECRQFRGRGTRVSPQYWSEDKSSDINRNESI